MNRSNVPFILILAFLSQLSSCGKVPLFLHHHVPAPTRDYQGTHVIKELVGAESADIVWVIDNSRSMADEQALVANNIQSFLDNFLVSARGVDWRMGLLSTDALNAPFVGFSRGDELNSQTPQPALRFRNAVGRLGILGSGYEEVFNPIKNAFAQFPQFIRPKGMLFLVIVTDEVLENGRQSVSSFVDYLTTLKGSLKNVGLYAVTAAKELGCDDGEDPRRTFAGSRYEELLNLMQGQHYTVCDPNFGQNIADIGRAIGQRVAKPRIQLKTRPNPGSIQVFYKDQELPGGDPEAGGYWFYDLELNTVVFHDLNFAAGDNEEVQLRYKVKP